MQEYQTISFCTGIGGFELGLAIAQLDRFIKLIQCVEINRYCQELIKLRFPGVPIWDDLTTYNPQGIDGDRTIICSGFPCQPVSGAGKQRGDKDSRYLWPHIIRLIRQIRPICWVGENVDGLRTIDSGRLFGTILQELSESGFAVEWSCVSAAEVGAVHKRERIWIIAYRPQFGINASHTQSVGLSRIWSDCTPQPTQAGDALISSGAEFTHTSSAGHQRSEWQRFSGAGWEPKPPYLSGQPTRKPQVGFNSEFRIPNSEFKNAQSSFCGSNDGLPSDVGRYLLRHTGLELWIGASTIPTFTRLSREEVGSLSREDQIEYKALFREYQRTKREYEQWLEALGNAICPHQAAVCWQRVGQILNLY